MSEPKRLHPIAAVLSALKQLKELIFPFIIIVVLGDYESGWDLLPLFGGIAALLLILLYGILSWLRYTFRVEEGELRIEYGVFIRKKRYIPFERIQSLDFSEGIFHRPFGLVKVKVETAGTSDLNAAEAELAAVKKEEALAIQAFLQNMKKLSHSDSDERSVESKEEIVYQISPFELFLLASTSGGVGVVISAVVAFILQFDDLIPYEKIFKEFEHLIANGLMFISIIVFIAFLFAWVAAVIWMMIKYGNFTLKRVDNDLIISRGLIEKRQLTIPLNRIQAIRISENLLRQPFGFATVSIESAGWSLENEGSGKVMILPIIKREKIREILGAHIKEYSLLSDCIPAPKRSLRRYLFRGWIFCLVPIIILILFFKAWGLLSLAILPIVTLWSYYKYKDAGWRLEDNQLTLRYRTIVKHTVFMKKNKIQAFDLKESYFQKRKKLATIQSTVMSGIGGAGGKVVDLEKDHCSSMYNWYSRSNR